MAAQAAWVLNLEAEDELAHPGHLTPNAASQARLAELVPLLIGTLVPHGDIVVNDPAASGLARGLVGQAWCPTPSALRRLARAGALLPPSPPFEVLRLVNGRAFCAALGQTLPRAAFALTEADVALAVAQPSPSGEWLLKRQHGFTGRGRLKVGQGELDASSWNWVRASLRKGGLQIEPWVERDGDYALHGLLSPDGSLTLGRPTAQRCSPQGAWLGTEPAGGDISPAERSSLEDEARRAARALFEAGYAGPFNLDAFRWRDDRGASRWNPRCEINARYSMGWAVGMGRAERVGLFPAGGDEYLAPQPLPHRHGEGEPERCFLLEALPSPRRWAGAGGEASAPLTRASASGT